MFPSDVLRALRHVTARRGWAAGNISMVFGFALAPMAVLGATALEAAQIQGDRLALQAAVDSAALSAASNAITSHRRRAANTIFRANREFSRGFRMTRRTLTRDGNAWTYTATATRALTFGAFVGKSHATLTATATAVRTVADATEIAIVHDTTNSMAFGSGWVEATDAIEMALSEIRAGTRNGLFRVSYVPFQDRVNIGTGNADWLGVAAPAGWNGCVEPREETIGAFDFALDDARPRHADRFDPSAPGFYGPLGASSPPKCPVPIVTPTDDPTDVSDTLRSITRRGTGRYDEGLAWGWRMLSPQWRPVLDAAGAPRNYDAARKILFFVTDGRSSAYEVEVGADSANSFGYNNGTRLGWDHTADLCRHIKDTGVEIHVLHVNHHLSPTPEHETYLSACATNPETHYHRVDDLDGWVAAFTQVASEFASVRLTH